jgi:hypothetical protein
MTSLKLILDLHEVLPEVIRSPHLAVLNDHQHKKN